MSRFDLFFVILDECDEISDYNIARHILDVHQSGLDHVGDDQEFSREALQRYIRYVRTLKPQLTEAAQARLVQLCRQLCECDMCTYRTHACMHRQACMHACSHAYRTWTHLLQAICPTSRTDNPIGQRMCAQPSRPQLCWHQGKARTETTPPGCSQAYRRLWYGIAAPSYGAAPP